MRLLSHPLRLDGAGSMVTIEQGSPRHAAELAGAVVSTIAGERGLSPRYGIPDPVGTFPSPDLFAGAIAYCEPDLNVISLEFDVTPAGRVSVRADVGWLGTI